MPADKLPIAAHEDGATLELLGAPPDEQARALVRLGLPPATVLVLENACENRCFFCSNPGTRAVPPERMTSRAAIEARLGARPEGVDRLLVGGNEPVLHPELDRALAFAAAAGYRRIEVMTSGLSLEPATLARWRALGVEALSIPIYAASATLHDAICGTPSWERLVRGVRAARAAGIEPRLHTVVMRRTLGELPALARWVHAEVGGRLALAPLREKADVFRYDDEAVPLAELEAALATLGDDAPVSLVGMPACVAPSVPRDGAAIIQVYFRTQRRAFAPACDACAARAACPGVVVAELARRGDAGLTPRRDRSVAR